MPLYEYECRACESRFERLVSLAEADGAVCPSCGATEARRVPSVIGGMTGRMQAPAPPCARGACDQGACAALG